MGNGFAKLTHCLSGDGHRRHGAVAVMSEPYDEGFGHSFCYVRPDTTAAAAAAASSKVYNSEETTTFRTISGASVSANTATSLSTSLFDLDCPPAAAAAFESSTSFSSVPLQPVPRFSSGPLCGPLAPADRGFLSGPIERGFMSGPLDHRAALFSGPLDLFPPGRLPRSLSHGLASRPRSRRAAASLLRGLTKAIARTISSAAHVAPIKGPKDSDFFADDGGGGGGSAHPSSGSDRNSVEGGEDSDFFSAQSGSIQWAQGKAGEDRVHVVVSEEHEWVFVGIYDGFNGPDATDYLLSNLYSAVQQELKGLLWEDKYEGGREPSDDPVTATITATEAFQPSIATNWIASDDYWKEGRQRRRKVRGVGKKCLENQMRWKCEWKRERLELDRRLKEQLNRSSSGNGSVNHLEVLKALSRALRKTEESFLDIADKMVSENPELALMGSCVLAMLMKGEDVYLMNVGDSRAILAQKAEPSLWSLIGKARQDLERINEETLNDLEAYNSGDPMDGLPNLAALQLTLDHCTCVEEEVRRIRSEHPDDASAIMNDRVKGSLKVTRAFGAGFLKQPKWNNALLEMFRIDYVGTSPYISCNPYLYHYKLSPKDRFLILSSDGLYQYFTNEEAVAQVELFIATHPEGDPAQHLVEEVLFRAAKKAGMDFHELLEIPQGDRRRYHDDVSIIVISLEGRIWRSCV